VPEVTENPAPRSSLERATGQLYSELWGPYDAKLFEESVELFTRRLELAHFDKGWFEGKTCLDAGCGGGRNSIAMARLGARQVHGVDVGEQGLADARRRAGALTNVEFKGGSVLDLPLPSDTYDLVWCAGVIMHTADEERALDEVTRVTKPGGLVYLLVYATGGLRWPLIQWLRPLAAQIGREELDRALELGKLPANKRRIFLDDLFVPKFAFFSWDKLRQMLETRGHTDIQRWGTEVRLDHEQDLASYRVDLEWLLAIFRAGDAESFAATRPLFVAGRQAIEATIDTIRWFELAVAQGRMTEADAMDKVIGQGHHRVLSRKRA